MSYPINYPTPQNANVQIFNAPTTGETNQTWVKPQGASFVWFTLIGGGSAGDGTTGGGSGAVTNFMCPAFLIPDSLSIAVGVLGTTDTYIWYQYGTQILTASGGSGSSGGQSAANNFFTAMGFFQSVSGQNGSASNINASSTIFLSGGGASTSNQISNYGYTTGSTGNRNGFFQMQPIIVGSGGMGTGRGGIGCGGGVNVGSGGPGLAVIITW